MKEWEIRLAEILKDRQKLNREKKKHNNNVKKNLTIKENEIFDQIISKAPKKEKLEKLSSKLDESIDKNTAIKTYLEELVNFIYKILHKKRFE
jgi:hypothetical protein